MHPAKHSIHSGCPVNLGHSLSCVKRHLRRRRSSSSATAICTAAATAKLAAKLLELPAAAALRLAFEIEKAAADTMAKMFYFTRIKNCANILNFSRLEIKKIFNTAPFILGVVELPKSGI